MNQANDSNVLADSVEDIRRFPLRRLYFILIVILAIISLISLSVQTSDINPNLWRFSAEIKVSSLTLMLLFLGWLPLLLPWIVRLSPRFRTLLSGLREGGVEEIEAGILKIKLAAGVQKAAEVYENKIQKTTNTKEPSSTATRNLEDSYKETLDILSISDSLSPLEAMRRIDQLALYYDHVRETMASSHERTRLMSKIASTMWSLMPSTQDFPLRERLNSDKGGERLSAYKFIEWRPDIAYLDALLSRAIGVLEVPFGQYNALLALRRLVTTSSISTSRREFVLQTLKWAASLEYMGSDRRMLMQMINIALDQRA